MKSIYESVKNILEGNYTGKNVPRSTFNKVPIAPRQTSVDQSGQVQPARIFPDVRGSTGAVPKSKSIFGRAADLEKSLSSNPLPVNPSVSPKSTSVELPSVKSSKLLGTTSFTSPAPVVTKGPSGSEKIPADASVPAYIRQNKPEPVMTEKPPVKSADTFVPSATRDGKPYDSNLLTGKALEKVASAGPAKNVPVTDSPAVFKTNPERVAAQKAKELSDRMDQMQQQGIGQTKPKVSSDYYKNLKALGMKTSNESRMSSAYSTIRRILGERFYTYDQLKEYQDKRDVAVQDQEKKDLAAIQAELKKGKKLDPKVKQRYDELTAKNKPDQAKPQADMTTSEKTPKVGEYIDIKNKPQTDNKLSPITQGSLGKRIDVARVDLEKDNSRGSQTKYLADKGLKGNEAMKKQEAEAAKKAAADAAKKAAATPTVSNINKPAQSVMAPAPTTTVSREAEKSGPDVQGMKKGIASNQKYDKPIDTVTATKDNADSEKPVEAPTEKPQASTETPKPSTADDYKTGDYRRFDPNAPLRGEFSRVNVSKDAESKTPTTQAEPAKPQAAAQPSSSEFKFSADQEKWLGKANRQDPYILNRMPGDKPPVDYYKDPKDQELAKKINTGNETVKKIKGVLGMKESNINKKFNVSDALYTSVMEVMKKDKKEGSVPRTPEEEKLAAFHGDPKRITHGDVLKARGVTKEEAEPVEEMSSKMKMKLGLYGKKKKTNEESVEEGIMDKVLPILTGGSDKDLLKKLQKDMGVPQTGQKPAAPVPAKPVKENKDTPGNGYAHQCAVHVKSESFGEGRTITTQHADPDDNGNIEWYDVMFEHGIERYVPTSSLEILVSEMHGHSKKKKM